MNNNLFSQVLKKELQKKILNYLYQNNNLTISEYEALIYCCEERIKKEKNDNKYPYPLMVDISILR